MPGEYIGRRGSAQSYISGLIQEGMSNTEITEWLRDNDLSYRNQYMLADINRMRLEEQGAWAIKGLDPDSPVPEKLMKTWHGETEFAYRVVINYSFFDTRTMTAGVSGTTLYFDHPPSEREVMGYWDLHKESLQNLYNNIEEVFQAERIMYFRNVKA